MLTLRRMQGCGHSNLGWLESYHIFSFGGYYAPDHMGFSNLRVINDDTIAPGGGFATHRHDDMEIISYVLEGSLEHKDSMGNGSVIRPGDVQRMSAGTGVTHSEFNHSSDEPVHFLQIWLLPNRTGVEPGYEQRRFPLEDRREKLVLLVSPDGRNGSIKSNQDALLYGTYLEAGQRLNHVLASDRRAYVHVADGKASVNGEDLGEGDAMAIEGLGEVELQGIHGAELLIFDLP